MGEQRGQSWQGFSVKAAWLTAACVGFLSLGILLLILAVSGVRAQDDWNAFFVDHPPPTTCDPGHHREDQCEAPAQAGMMVEPWNTLSNVGYLLVGCVIVFRARNASGFATGISIFLVGIFSALYHARLTPMSQILDVGAIYGVFGALTLMAMEAQPGTVRSSKYPIFPSFDWLIALGLVVTATAAFMKVDKDIESACRVVAAIVGGVVLLFWLVPRFDVFARLLGHEPDPGGTPWLPRPLVWIVTPLLFAVIGYFLKWPLGFNSTMLFIVLALSLFVKLVDLGLFHENLRHEDRGRLGILFFALALVASGAFALRLNDGSDCSTVSCAEVNGSCALAPGAPTPPAEANGSCRRATPKETEAAGKNAQACVSEPFVVPKLFCHPNSIFQAHAWWHFLGALALLLAYEIITLYQSLLASEGGPLRNRTVFFDP